MRHFIFTGAAMLLICLLISSGCISVGPDYKRPEIKTPDEWSLAVDRDFSTNSPMVQTWWEVFHDDMLNDLITACAASNLNLMAAVARIEDAAAQIGVARADWYPAIRGAGAVTPFHTSKAITPFLPDEFKRSKTIYTLGGSVGWELDIWGRVRRISESYTARWQRSVEDYRDILVMLYGDVAYQYMTVRTLQERIRIAEENAGIQEDTLKLTADRNAAGLVPDLDVQQARMNLAETRAAIPPLRRQLNHAIHRLSILTGQPPAALAGLLGKPRALPDIPALVTVGIPAEVMRQRPDVRSAERALAAAHAMIGARKAELYPTFSLPGTFVLKAYSASDLDGDALDYSFGPQFIWNLFSGGRVRSRIMSAEARTHEAEAHYREVVLEALEEVENAMVSIQQDRLEIVQLRKAVDAATKSVEMVRSLYASGLTDFQNVLVTERALRGHQDRLAEREGRLATDIVMLYKALGGGWVRKEQMKAPQKQADQEKEHSDSLNANNSQEKKK